VKAEHHSLAGLSQPLPISEWNCDGFHYGSTNVSKVQEHDMGNRGPIDWKWTFRCRPTYWHMREANMDLQQGMWGSTLASCLEAVANIVGIATELQYCLSFSNMRRNERTKRSLRGHIESVCIRILRVVRWALAIRRSYNNSYQTTIMMGTIWCNIWERV
jgi:hypothetical protein